MRSAIFRDMTKRYYFEAIAAFAICSSFVFPLAVSISKVPAADLKTTLIVLFIFHLSHLPSLK